MSTTQTDDKKALREYVNCLGLTYTATFQPRPQPRETVEHPQLHWLITLSNGKQSAQFPYFEGIAHVQGYQQPPWNGRMTIAQAEEQKQYRKTCETGLLYNTTDRSAAFGTVKGKQPAPDLLDVLYCLVSDASVRHVSTYEEWASDYGYDADSRKGEETYRACQKQTTDLLRVLGGGTVGRNALDRLEKLEELFQDY